MKSTTMFTIGFVLCVIGICCMIAAVLPNNAPSGEPVPQDELGITEVVVQDENLNIRSVAILDERTGKYRYYNSENLSGHGILNDSCENISGSVSLGTVAMEYWYPNVTPNTTPNSTPVPTITKKPRKTIKPR